MRPGSSNLMNFSARGLDARGESITCSCELSEWPMQQECRMAGLFNIHVGH